MLTKLRRVRIIADNDHGSPREDFDNLGTMVFFSDRYTLGDETHVRHRNFSESYLNELVVAVRDDLAEQLEDWSNGHYGWFEEMLGWNAAADVVDQYMQELVLQVVNEHYLIFPLTLLEGPYLSLRVGSIGADFERHDGWIYVAKSKLPEEGIDEETAANVLLGECETYRQSLEGDVYYFVIEEAECDEDDPDGDDAEWEQVESCGGFYGSDVDENGMLEHVPKELHEQLRKASVEYL